LYCPFQVKACLGRAVQTKFNGAKEHKMKLQESATFGDVMELVQDTLSLLGFAADEIEKIIREGAKYNLATYCSEPSDLSALRVLDLHQRTRNMSDEDKKKLALMTLVFQTLDCADNRAHHLWNTARIAARSATEESDKMREERARAEEIARAKAAQARKTSTHRKFQRYNEG
jgi:hypothetical protein